MMQAQFPATYVNYIGLPDESRVKSVVKLCKATTYNNKQSCRSAHCFAARVSVSARA